MINPIFWIIAYMKLEYHISPLANSRFAEISLSDCNEEIVITFKGKYSEIK